MSRVAVAATGCVEGISARVLGLADLRYSVVTAL